MNLRWMWAGAITLVAFGSATYLCGAFVLPAVLRDSGARWGVASSAGVALAALVALWGERWAEMNDGRSAGSGAEGRRVSNTIKGGTFYAPVVQAGDVRPASSPPGSADSDDAPLGGPS